MSYPPHWEADVVVADGGTVHLRPMRPTDADAVVKFHAGLSPRTRYLRYFSAYPRIPERDLYRFTNVDHHDRVALVAWLGDEIIAVGRYEREPGTDEAEVAFVVADAHQGRGIGSVLLEHLAAAARESGVVRFTALVLAENDGMIRVFREAGYQTTRHVEYGEISLAFDIDETVLTEEVMREREQHAEARSIRRLLFPRSVAVVGASSDVGKIGNVVFRNLLRMGLEGTLYPVNEHAPHVSGVRAYPSVLDVPDPIDLAVICVPADVVPPVVSQCAAKGVHGLVVISGGYGEHGSEAGRTAQRALVAESRQHGMRVIGPNCLGVINTDPAVRLNASLATLAPLAGRAGFFCQSGALGIAVLGEAARRGLGVSTFVSAGTRADVSGNDLLQYWETDEATDVVLLYLESFGNPRKFARLARRLGRRKPIVAVKSGRASLGPVSTGPASTAVQLPDVTVATLFEASGVIRVDTLGDLLEVALLLTTQPLPGGDRVAVVSNSTAVAVLVADACASEQLPLQRLIDVGTDAAPDVFEAAVLDAVNDPEVDAIVAVFVPPLQHIPADEYALALHAASAAGDKPVLSTFLGFEGVPSALAQPGPYAPSRGSVPSYPTPERAVRALASVVRYAQWRRRPPGELPVLDADVDGARALVETALASGSDVDAPALLACYGIALDSSTAAAERGTAPARPGASESSAVEVVLGLHDDPSFGALVSFGVGGVATELLGDRAYASVPLTDVDAAQLIRAPKAAPLLSGYGGAPPASLDALAEVVLRLSALADDCPEVVECSLVARATPAGVHVDSARIRVGPPTARADTGPRRLRGL
ncbi:MAG TPA: GNAT family N-acetyltransferase [Jatrophihabitantaceae bacterium]